MCRSAIAIESGHKIANTSRSADRPGSRTAHKKPTARLLGNERKKALVAAGNWDLISWCPRPRSVS
jgi:hypothetical protein